tara:strand:- start:130 stop:753 length:624 start_codon:yes stop_codon:yes gene_type:complete
MIKVTAELILDQTKELFDLGLGHATEEISQLVDSEVKLSVASANFCPLNQIAQELGGVTRYVVAIYHEFIGELEGKGFLIIDQESSIRLVRYLLNDEFHCEYMTETEKDVIVDLCSEITNGVLAVLKSSLDLKLTSRLPKYLEGTLGSILNEMMGKDAKEDLYLLVKVSVELADKNALSELIFVQTHSDFQNIIDPLTRLIQNKMES